MNTAIVLVGGCLTVAGVAIYAVIAGHAIELAVGVGGMATLVLTVNK